MRVATGDRVLTGHSEMSEGTDDDEEIVYPAKAMPNATSR